MIFAALGRGQEPLLNLFHCPRYDDVDVVALVITAAVILQLWFMLRHFLALIVFVAISLVVDLSRVRNSFVELLLSAHELLVMKPLYLALEEVRSNRLNNTD